MALLFVFHAFVFSLCYVAAWLARFEFDIPESYIPHLINALPYVVSVQLLVGVLFGFYRGWWRYVGLVDVVRLVAGLSVAGAILLISWYAGPMLGIPGKWVRSPRGVLLTDFAFSLLALFGARALVRLGRDRFRPEPLPSEARRVLIIGAGDAGETLAREIEHRPQLGMRVVGFVDDQRAKWGSHIRGIRVSGGIANIASIADDTGATEALIAIPSASGKRVREIIHHLAAADLQFKTIPGIDQLVSGRVHVTQLRPVQVEDLLRRARIDLPGDAVQKMLHGKRVVVTGAGGTIGAELAAQVLQMSPERLILVERSEYLLYECHKRLSREVPWAMDVVSNHLLDIQNEELVRELIEAERPQIVLHAAAHKHVPLGEQNPGEYIRNNTLATRSLAEICAAANVERFVLVSTDKAINPTSVMGASKRAAEIVLFDLARTSKMNITAVRFGNVIGSSGSVIPLFLEQIAAGGPVTVTHPEVTRYFIRTSEAISLVLQAATIDAGGHAMMLDMGEPVKIVELARDLIRLSNHTEEEIPITFTGLRRGEKLFEEITLTGESIRPTIHPQIVLTIAPQPAPDKVALWLQRARNRATPPIPLLKELVPEFESDFQAAPNRQGQSTFREATNPAFAS